MQYVCVCVLVPILSCSAFGLFTFIGNMQSHLLSTVHTSSFQYSVFLVQIVVARSVVLYYLYGKTRLSLGICSVYITIGKPTREEEGKYCALQWIAVNCFRWEFGFCVNVS